MIDGTTFLLVIVAAAIVTALLAKAVHFNSPELEADPDPAHPVQLLPTKPAIWLQIWMTAASVCALGCIVWAAFWGWAAFLLVLIVAVILLVPQWVFLSLRDSSVDMNYAYIMVHERTGRRYAIVGVDIPVTLPGGGTINKGQAGQRLLPSIFLVMQDKNKHKISLERRSVDDQHVEVIVEQVSYDIVYSFSYVPDRNRLIDFIMNGSGKVDGAIEGSLTEGISNAAAGSTREMMNRKIEFSERVRQVLHVNVVPANNPMTRANRDITIIEDLRETWALGELIVNIEKITRGEDQRQVEEGEAQSVIIRRIARQYQQIELPPRNSAEYRAFLVLAPIELVTQQQKQKKGQRGGGQQPQPNFHADEIEAIVSTPPVTEDDHVKRDGLVLAVIIKKRGMISAETALDQANIVTNQAKATVIGGRGGRRNINVI